VRVAATGLIPGYLGWLKVLDDKKIAKLMWSMLQHSLL